MNTKSIIVTGFLLLLGLSLLVFNRLELDFFDSYSRILDIQLILLGLILFATLFLTFFKGTSKMLSKSIVILAVVLIIWEMGLAFISIQKIQSREFVKEYSEMNCTELLERFELDKSRNKFIYYGYGIYVPTDEISRQFKEEYNIEVVVTANGCIGDANSNCYNVALMDYLENKPE